MPRERRMGAVPQCAVPSFDDRVYFFLSTFTALIVCNAQDRGFFDWVIREGFDWRVWSVGARSGEGGHRFLTIVLNKGGAAV
jgi:hypothetical protein